MNPRLLVLCALPLTALTQTISFLPPNAVQIGGAVLVSDCSSCVAVADFNGDAKPDIAYNAGTPLPQGGVLLGNGDGTFRPVLPLSYPSTGGFLVGDFNGDGKPDLVFFGTYSTSVYLGKGDGTFSSPVTVQQCGGRNSSASIQVGDFNRDSKTDLLCGTSVLLSNGDGTFRAAGTVGTQANESVLLVADFNGDGIADVLLLRAFRDVAVSLGHGDATFGSELAPIYGFFRTSYYANFLAADFNSDGKIDLIAFSDYGEWINFLPGNGDGTFGSVVQTDISSSSVPEPMTAVGDFNRDGKLDFVAGSAVYAGNGDGTFRFPVFFGPTAYPCQGAQNSPVTIPCAYAHEDTAVGDFNGDGLPDLAAYVIRKPEVMQIKESAELDFLLNDSPGNGFTAAGVSAATGTSPVGPGSIVSAYGVNLTTETAVASMNPAPTTLGGIRVHIRDRTHTGDRLAPLLYVSPTQINYLLNSTDSYAWVDIERIGVPYTPQGMTVPIAAVAPGFFAAPYTSNAPGYLSLYGTGFAQAIAAQSSCTAGSVGVPITYAGPEIQIAGLDQVNLLLPASLAGAGSLPLYCQFQNGQEGGVSNVVNVTIR
jgi:uncharacterized protein (TIGR03437 family)